MPHEIRVGDPRVTELEAAGWRVVARSWAAELNRPDAAGLARIVDGAQGLAIRMMTEEDLPAILDLDRRTLDDYPGGAATRHEQLGVARATPTETRCAFGAFADGCLIGMTYVDLGADHADTDFTVVSSEWRGRGVATATKAASILSLTKEGFTRFRTGGDADNQASLRANLALGYRVDDEWVTLRAPD